MRKLWVVLAKYFALAFLVGLAWNALKSNPPVAAMACGVIVAIFISYAMGMFQRNPQKDSSNTVQAVEQKRGTLIRPAEVPCRNCGRMVSNLPPEDNANSDIMTKCPHCGAVWTKSWRDFGIDMDDFDGSMRLYENPNPQNAQFGVEIGDTPAPQLEKSLLDIMNDSVVARSGKNITRLVTLLESCADAEEQYKHCGYFPPPRPYQEAAEEARFHADYVLEDAICKRFIEIVNFETLLQEKFKKVGVNFKGMPFYGVALDRIEVIKTLINKGNNSEIKYIFEQKEPTNSEKKQKLFLQCAEYGIALDNYTMSYSKDRKAFLFDEENYFSSPSKAFLYHLRKLGWSGTDYEFAPVMQIMQAACLEYLQEKAIDFSSGLIPDIEGKSYYQVQIKAAYVDGCLQATSGGLEVENHYARSLHRQIKMYGLDRTIILENIRTVNDQTVLNNWRTLISDQQNKQWFPELTENDMASLLEALGREKLVELASCLFENPDDNANGWPDIWAIKDGKIALFEVKSGDTLRDTQIRTFSELIPKYGFEARVVRIKKVNI